MPSSQLFIRHPGEVPYLREELTKMLRFATGVARGLSVREDDDFGFMTVQFLYKQIQHAESVLLLVPRRDAGLIARSMVDGLYQLFWAAGNRSERGRRWRSFSVIHDWRLIQRRIREGISVSEEDTRKNKLALKEFGHIHLKNTESTDPYYRKWCGNTTLSKMANGAGRELYDVAYADLSDWEHWGVAGIGEAITRNGNNISVGTHSERVAGQALLAAFQCLHETVRIVDNHLSLNMSDKIASMGAEFMKGLDAFS